MERRLAAILAADVVGYSRLMAADEQGTHARLKALRQDFIEPEIAKHRGRVVKLMGDGVLVEFASVVDAVECAAAMQKGVAEVQASLPVNQRIALRIGINIGDIIIEDGDIYGGGVNVAARLEALAEPGGICVSRTVYNHVKDKVAFGFAPAGAHQVKNIPEPVVTYRMTTDAELIARVVGRKRLRLPARRIAAVVGATLLVLGTGGISSWLWLWPAERTAAVLPPEKSIAVLPFDNLSGESEQDYFSNGLTEDLITNLSKVSGLRVSGRSAVFRYRDKPVNPQEIGEDLGVRYVLEGSVRRANDRVRINAQLIDAGSGFHLWAEQYDRKLEDIFALQTEVTKRIADTLEVALTEKERRAIERRYTNSQEAYDYLLRARTLRFRFTEQANAEARRLLEKAIGLDPGFARAYGELAGLYFDQWDKGWSDDPALMDRALAVAGKAVELSPDEPWAHEDLAFIHVFRGEHDDALEHARRAIDLDPDFAVGYFTLSVALAFAGRFEDSLAAVKRCMELDPNGSPMALFGLGRAQYFLGDHEQALASMNEFLNRIPTFPAAYEILAQIYVETGQQAKAEQAIKELVRISPGRSVASVKVRSPYRNRGDLERVLDALRSAGLPET